MADEASLIEKFKSLTGASSDVAKSYLESCAWNCDEAIGSFFEEGSPLVNSNIEEEEAAMDFAEPESVPSKSKAPAKRTGDNSRISTLSSLRNNDNDDDSSEEEGQAFYAGGGLHHGQQILGPKKDKNDIKNVFSKAKEHGAEVIDKSEYERQKGNKGRQKVFQGQAYRLGDTEGQSEVVGASGSDNTTREIDTVLTFWSNGFTVNHGPLRDPAEPENALFLAQIKKGQIPKELLQEARGNRVNLMMEDCSTEEFKASTPKLSPFTGTGHRLGSPATDVSSESHKVTEESSVDKKQEKIEGDSGNDVYTAAVDDSKPITNIQVRLPDGSRHVLKFNHSHTVQDIRNFIANIKPSLASTPFILLSSFPRQELKDEAKTISEANLINALVIVKLT